MPAEQCPYCHKKTFNIRVHLLGKKYCFDQNRKRMTERQRKNEIARALREVL